MQDNLARKLMFPGVQASEPNVQTTTPAPTPAARISFERLKKKLGILADAAKYDASCASSGVHRKRFEGGMGNAEGMGICHSFTPDGRCVSLLKILMTNQCIYDCKFCINRLSSDVERARFTPEEIVWLTLEFYRRNYIEGLFLSSGIINSVDDTMEQLIRTAKLLRETHKFAGYIHLKVVPGASPELTYEAGRWADRVSANIELPTQRDLDELAPAKRIITAEETMTQVKSHLLETAENKKKFLKTPSFAPAGQTTQMIVGATPASDSTILQTTQKLYGDFKIRRVYYSAYSPIPNASASLPIQKPSLVRENRLYQADWLLRFYGFKAQELLPTSTSNLSLETDPKTAWALQNRQQFPVDVNRAPKEVLLRIPGIGVRNVDRILAVRNQRFLSTEDLRRLKINWKKARYFVLATDYNPDVHHLDRLALQSFLEAPTQQLSLFESAASARTGEV